MLSIHKVYCRGEDENRWLIRDADVPLTKRLSGPDMETDFHSLSMLNGARKQPFVGFHFQHRAVIYFLANR